MQSFIQIAYLLNNQWMDKMIHLMSSYAFLNLFCKMWVKCGAEYKIRCEVAMENPSCKYIIAWSNFKRRWYHTDDNLIR